MSFDYTLTQSEVTELLKEMGLSISISKYDGSKVRTYGIWGKSEKKDVAVSVSQVTGESKIMYIPGNLKKVPEVGDSIVIGASNWSVDVVELYCPANTVIAYKLTVSM